MTKLKAEIQLNPDIVVDATHSGYSADVTASDICDVSRSSFGFEGGMPKVSIPDLSSRTKAMIFHCAFKLFQILFYMFSSKDSSVTLFLIISILIVLDFWSVKNVTGRLMVGLRWWTATDQTGKDIYHFESYDFKLEGDSKFSTVFWSAQLSITLFWALFLFFDIITFKLFWVYLA